MQSVRLSLAFIAACGASATSPPSAFPDHDKVVAAQKEWCGTLAKLYGDLLASEARHHQIYVELAEQLAAPSVVRDRLQELARREAEILQATSPRVRLHS